MGSHQGLCSPHVHHQKSRKKQSDNSGISTKILSCCLTIFLLIFHARDWIYMVDLPCLNLFSPFLNSLHFCTQYSVPMNLSFIMSLVKKKCCFCISRFCMYLLLDPGFSHNYRGKKKKKKAGDKIAGKQDIRASDFHHLSYFLQQLTIINT